MTSDDHKRYSELVEICARAIAFTGLTDVPLPDVSSSFRLRRASWPVAGPTLTPISRVGLRTCRSSTRSPIRSSPGPMSCGLGYSAFAARRRR